MKIFSPDKSNESSPNEKSSGFGTMQGVFIPSTLTILGVIMYLRMGWVVSNVGMSGTFVIVTLSSIITFITALSISATATNMKVGQGGAYFMISRSFGIEAGASIGIPLYLAQALGISFYIAGFAESIVLMFPAMDFQIVAFSSLVILTLLAFFSTDVALKAQVFIFAIIIASIVSFLLGGPVEGTNSEALPSIARAGFWEVFAVFFPAVTGILTGVSMSGDLKNPGRSLPRGTIASVIVGYLIYLLIPFILNNWASSDILHTTPMIMAQLAIFPAAIFAGIWGATLSSALGSLLGAPRTLQALAKDRIVFPIIGRSFGKSNSPHGATIITFLLSGCGLYLGDLNAIAPVLSMFFLTAYGVLNLVAGLEGMIGNPSWRPVFRPHWSISLIGALGCICTMLMIDSGSSFIALFACLGIYMFMRSRRLSKKWSDMRGGILQFFARFSIYQLADLEKDARSWRPNILVLSGSPTSRWYLIELCDSITHGKGFLTVASIIQKEFEKKEKLIAYQKTIKEFLRKRDVPALIRVKYCANFLLGAQSLIKNYGMGPLTPNTIVMGETEDKDQFTDYCQLIRDAYFDHKNIVILRAGENQFSHDGQKSIDVWWGRLHNNANLSLVLAYMLDSNPRWAGSKLTLKSLVKSDEEKQGVQKSLSKLLMDSRITANLEVLVNPEGQIPFQTIANDSASADLIFIGMRPPELDESIEDYVVYYQGLLEKTKHFPLTAFTLMGQEDISFGEIFV